MARLNKTQTYAIYWMNNEGKDAEEISEALKLSVDQVIKCLEKAEVNTQANKKMKNKNEPAVAKKRKKNLPLVEKKDADGNSTVTITTKGFTELADEHRKKNKSNPISIRNKDAIFRPK
jgi:transposase